MADIIYCLVGRSGSGKTTVGKELDKRGYNVIQSYTTRAPRTEGEWGHTFVNEIDYAHTEDKPWFGDNVIAYNKIYGHHYWATKEQYEGKGASIYIIDPPGVDDLRGKVDVPLVIVYLAVSDNTCFLRMQKERGKEEAFERIMKDQKKYACVPTHFTVDASRRIDDVVELVEGVIKKF